MHPQVRDAIQSQIAVNSKARATAPVNAIQPATPLASTKAKASVAQAETSDSPLVSRRKRWARLSNRH